MLPVSGSGVMPSRVQRMMQVYLCPDGSVLLFVAVAIAGL
jgi:hypothetical protein